MHGALYVDCIIQKLRIRVVVLDRNNGGLLSSSLIWMYFFYASVHMYYTSTKHNHMCGIHDITCSCSSIIRKKPHSFFKTGPTWPWVESWRLRLVPFLMPCATPWWGSTSAYFYWKSSLWVEHAGVGGNCFLQPHGSSVQEPWMLLYLHSTPR